MSLSINTMLDDIRVPLRMLTKKYTSQAFLPMECLLHNKSAEDCSVKMLK